MAFALDPDKPFDEAVKKLAVSQLEDAIKALKKHPRGLHEAIHDARKKFKRVRGLLRLVRRLAPELAAAENERIRNVAADLSSERDATAFIECVTYLRSSCHSGAQDMALSKLERALYARRSAAAISPAALKQRVENAVDTCKVTISAIEKANFETHRKTVAKRMAKAWEKQLTNAQVALMTAQAQGSDEDFHELRKKSQTYWMFCALLYETWRSALKHKRSEAKALADVLGHEHDLSVLLQLLDGDDAPDLDEQTLSTCRVVATQARTHLRRRAIKLARRAFGDEAHEEARTIRVLWNKRISAQNGR